MAKEKAEALDRTDVRCSVLAPTLKAIQAMAEKRGWPQTSAVEHLIKVGISRVGALKRHAKKKKDEAKVASKPRVKAKSKAKPRAKKAKAAPVAEAAVSASA